MCLIPFRLYVIHAYTLQQVAIVPTRFSLPQFVASIEMRGLFSFGLRVNRVMGTGSLPGSDEFWMPQLELNGTGEE